MSIEQSRSLVRVVHEGEERWYHIRKAGKKHPRSVIAREIPQLPDTQDETVPADDPRFATSGSVRQYTYEQINKMNVVPVKANEVKSEDLTMWMAIRDRIRTHDSDSKSRTVVPVTPLRRLYDFLRMNGNDAIHRCIAQGFDIEGLKSLWTESTQQLRDFKPDCSIRSGHTRAKLKLHKNPLGSTNDLVKRLLDHNSGQITFGDDPLNYAGRELNPLRTEGGILESGHAASSSGSGGMDLLLVSPDRWPIVGEIKIANDMNPFFALIQSLTFAAELSTSHQFGRLCDPSAFGDTFDDQSIHVPAVGICIIIARYPDELDRKGYLAKTQQLADELVEEDILFRADLLKAELDGDRLVFTPYPNPDKRR